MMDAVAMTTDAGDGDTGVVLFYIFLSPEKKAEACLALKCSAFHISDKRGKGRGKLAGKRDACCQMGGIIIAQNSNPSYSCRRGCYVFC